MSRHNLFVCILIVVVSTLLFSNTAFGWFGSTHSRLCTQTFNDPVVQPLLLGIYVDLISNYTGEPPGQWHNAQWDDIKDRAYISTGGIPNGNFWWGEDETTRLKYLTHNAADIGVPLGHEPAGEMPGGYDNDVLETYWELRATTWNIHPNVVGQCKFTNTGNGHVFFLIGTISEVVDTFYEACRDNMNYLKYAGDPETAFWNGMTLALMMQRAVLVDYLLAKENAVAVPEEIDLYGSVSFTGHNSHDTDNIIWKSKGYYYNDYSNGGGIEEYAWDFNLDGTWDHFSTNDTVTVSNSYLTSLGCDPYSWNYYAFSVRDDEGKWSETVGDFYFTTDGVPEPATMSLLAVGALAFLRRRSR